MLLFVTYQFVLIEESYLILRLVSGSLGFYGTVVLHSDGPTIDGVSLVAVYVRHCEGETLEPEKQKSQMSLWMQKYSDSIYR